MNQTSYLTDFYGEADLMASRAAFLAHSYPFIQAKGMTESALRDTAEAMGRDRSYAQTLFPKGPDDLVLFYHRTLLDQLRQELETLFQGQDVKVREKIFLGVQHKLNLMAPHKKAAREIIKYLLRPTSLRNSTSILYETVDVIWKAAGDRSVDYNFYTKRFLLSGVYTTTLMYWLYDTSADHAQTWVFLRHRIQEVLSVFSLGSSCFRSLRQKLNFQKMCP